MLANSLRKLELNLEDNHIGDNEENFKNLVGNL